MDDGYLEEEGMFGGMYGDSEVEDHDDPYVVDLENGLVKDDDDDDDDDDGEFNEEPLMDLQHNAHRSSRHYLSSVPKQHLACSFDNRRVPSGRGTVGNIHRSFLQEEISDTSEPEEIVNTPMPLIPTAKNGRRGPRIREVDGSFPPTNAPRLNSPRSLPAKVGAGALRFTARLPEKTASVARYTRLTAQKFGDGCVVVSNQVTAFEERYGVGKAVSGAIVKGTRRAARAWTEGFENLADLLDREDFEEVIVPPHSI